MVVNINLKLFKDNRKELEYQNINALKTNNFLSFFIDDVKTTINTNFFIRENNEYKFLLDIKNKKCTYLFKEKNMEFDIFVEKVKFFESSKQLTLFYKIESDESETKIKIELENGE